MSSFGSVPTTATYPVNCQGVNGTVGAGVSGSGNKTATWNAGSDWDQQFTPSGKIRVIATYGDSSGFAGTGGGSGGGSGGVQVVTMQI